jgi:hypothetical protein
MEFVWHKQKYSSLAMGSYVVVRMETQMEVEKEVSSL